MKPRQVGSTTLWILDFFADILIHGPMYMAIVSHEDEATARLLKKVETVYENLPEDKPRIHHDSTHEKSFPEIGSAIYIGTAGSRAFGRGDTFGRVLLTEFAHWTEEQAKTIRVGIQESAEHGRITVESTPNGEGNQFHLLYQAAKTGKSPYKAVFVPWYMNIEYSYPSNHPLVRDPELQKPILQNITAEEQMLLETKGLKYDQIRWRRVRMSGMVPGDDNASRAIFLQEYPEDDESCFASVSDSMFSQTALSLLRPAEPLFVEEGVKYWGKPIASRTYVISADCALGYGGTDRSVALILDISDYPKILHIGTVSGSYKDHEFARILDSLGKKLWYSQVVVEANDVGQSVLNTLINVLLYPNVYHQTDSVTRELKQRPGFLTTSVTKRRLTAEGSKIIDGMYLHTQDKDLIKELKFFRKYPDGTVKASPGMHDDFVMALLLGITATLDVPRSSGPKSQPYGYQW